MYLLLTNNYVYAIRNRYNGNRDKGILKLNILVIVFFFYPNRNKTTSHEKIQQQSSILISGVLEKFARKRVRINPAFNTFVRLRGSCLSSYLPFVPKVFLAWGENFRCRPKAEATNGKAARKTSGTERAFRAGHYKDLTETGTRARKVSGTQGGSNHDLGKKKCLPKQQGSTSSNRPLHVITQFEEICIFHRKSPNSSKVNSDFYHQLDSPKGEFTGLLLLIVDRNIVSYEN